MPTDGDRAAHPGRVTRAIRAPADRIWAALTEPGNVRRWWGELSPELRVGRLSQLSLDNGDRYALEVFRMEPPHRLEYGLRFYGIDVKEVAGWEIEPKGEGALVTVAYRTPGSEVDRRSVEHGEWLNHTERLERCLRDESLPPAPPDREFLLSTDLPGHPASIRDHLAGHLERLLASPPTDLRITGHADLSAPVVRLDVYDPAWLAPTSASLLTTGQAQGTRLTVRHRGWEGTAFDGAARARHRARLARFWHGFFLRFTLEYARSWQIPTLSATDLKDRMVRPEVFVLDANRRTLWERGHIPRAAFVGQEDIPLDRLPSDKQAELVFYCRDTMCLTAYLSAAKARTLGYPNTFVMEGGRQAWAQAGFPLVAESGSDGAVEEELDPIGGLTP